MPKPTPALISSNNISFESAISRPPSFTFTPPSYDRTSSNETSLLDDDDVLHIERSLKQELSAVPPVPSFTKASDDRKIIHELVDNGPCLPLSPSDELPRYVSFLIRYECHRVARRASMSPLQFFKEVSRSCKTAKPEYSAFWNAANAVCKSAAPAQKLQANEKSSSAAWDSAKGNFITDSNKSVILSGALTWADAPGKGLFELKLKPLQLEKSCRFERRFGGDRFLSLTIPELGRAVPQNLKIGAENTHSAISHWLGRHAHYIAGRYWRAFYVENVERKQNSNAPASFKVFLFAVSGVDISAAPPFDHVLGGTSSDHRTAVSLKEFIDWYMPIKSNIGSEDKKYFQRLKLGLSRSCPTVVLYQDEFVDLEDDPSWVKPMNDGCARMSRKLANEISKRLGLDHTPSAFQGRVSGGKGLWIVENDTDLYLDASKRRGFWIEVTSSTQLKVWPHPKDRHNVDAENRTFEVLAWSKPGKVGVMTKQLIPILHHGGVNKELLEEKLRGNVHDYYTDLLDAKKDTRLLRLWVQKHENIDRDGGVNMLGSFPKNRADQINLLLESGFSPDDNEIIVSRIRSCLVGYLDDYVDRLHLRIDMSTSVWCVPDPYGILECDEIQLNFSEPWICKDGQPLTTLWGLNCLVYRSPGYLPSDAQRVRGVFHPELAHLLNVAIFPVKGQLPLASMLSGGDYDGDKVWVCFDQSIVNRFKNTPVTLEPPTEAECGLVNKSRPLAEIFTPSSPKSSEVDEFLTECFSFNLQTPMLGQCSNQHEMVAYYKPLGHADPGALKLAALVGYLVDASKQGHFLSEQSWNSIRSKTSGKTQLNKPAYKSDDATNKNLNNIVDYLKFVVAMDEKEKILSQFQKDWKEGSNYDATLSAPYNKALMKYQSDKSIRDQSIEADKRIGRSILQKLKEDIDTIKLRFQTELARYKDLDDRYENLVWAMYEQLQAVVPRRDKDHDHEINRRYDDERDELFSSWSRLRASCFYYRWNKGVSPWYAAGSDLAKIKIDSKGAVRFMTVSMYQIMKPDGRLVKRLAQRALEDEGDGVDELVDDE